MIVNRQKGGDESEGEIQKFEFHTRSDIAHRLRMQKQDKGQKGSGTLT